MHELSDKKTIQSLEFERILEILAAYALSDEGRQSILACNFYPSYDSVRPVQEHVCLIAAILEAEQFTPRGMPTVSEEISCIQKAGHVLESNQLVKMAFYISQASECLDHFSRPDIPESLSALLQCEKPVQISRKILHCFRNDGSINPGLADVKKVLHLISGLEIKNSSLVQKYLHSWSAYLMFDNPSQKEGRIVLPVKAEYKNRTKGIIHQVSQTGNTVFIEPLEILENNNALLEAKSEYERIVFGYCRQLSELLHENAGTLAKLAEAFTSFDCLYVRARFLISFDCIFPAFVQSGFTILQARHLLLPADPVPVDLRLEHPLSALVISGSNAGGKTVSLKTLGLCVLMNQSAIPIPAAEGSALCFFSFIASDIGDSQSIDEAKSTFTGHLQRLSEIVCSERKNGLVLIDELGTGTSDDEGAALGISFLNTLVGLSNLVVSTTHNRKIKEFAFTSEFCETASVNFSAEKHIPLYGLSYGIHGDSHGIDTAVQCGVPGNVIEQARNILISGAGELDLAFDRIRELEQMLAKKDYEIQAKSKELESIRKSHKDDLNKLETIRESYKCELEEILVDTNRRIDDLRRNKTIVSKHDEADLKEKLYIELETVSHDITDSSERKPSVITLTKGMDILIQSLGQSGQLLNRQKNGLWLVQAGSLKLTVSESDILAVKQETVPVRPVIDRGNAVQNAPLQLDLRGKTVEEAIDLTAKHLDSMLACGQQYSSIIHGHGTLQNAVRHFLIQHRYVSKVEYAEQNNGGKGKSIIYLDN
ncbi:MAG: Smr/MutS family protein [Spirochaetales bacterium]|nr:Smr/MutS family protein [Spirochaetales bacterium]